MTDAVGGAAADPPGHGREPGLQPGRTRGPAGLGALLDLLRPAVVMFDDHGSVVLWSPPAEEMLGWTGEEAVGRHLDALLDHQPPPPGGSRAREGPAAPGERILAEIVRAGRWTGTVPLRRRDGSSVPVDVRASLLVDGGGRPFVLATLAETAAVGRVEHDMAVMDSLFASTPLGAAVFDTRLRYVRINEALARMNGLPAEAHLGHTVSEVLEESTASQLVPIQRSVLRTGIPVADVITISADRAEYRSVFCNRLEDRTGKVLGISAVVMDVTERHLSAVNAERVRHRLALLNDVGGRIGDLLDAEPIARELAGALVPRFGDHAGVVLLRSVAGGGELPRTPQTRWSALGRPAVAGGHDSADSGRPTDQRRARAMLGLASDAPLGEEPLFAQVLRSGAPSLLESPEQIAAAAAPDTAREPPAGAAPAATTLAATALDLGVHSMMVLPLRAQGAVLGLLVISRTFTADPFDRDDLALAMEIADRAGGALDNARLYTREREGALMLQRSLLPQDVPQPLGVELAYRYVPGSSGAEVGGDWFDVIPLAGGRVALVVGDVMGHGLRAAVTMGRLRTAVRTLAPLELSPGRLLRHLNDLADDLAYGSDEPLMATCVYAVYDPATRHVALARAGHLPPLLVEPAPGPVRQVETGSGAPLGVGGVEFEGEEFEAPDGAVLVLYTDGLVEVRGEDISAGIARLTERLARRHQDLEAACDDILTGLDLHRDRDDIAVLMARLGGLPENAAAAWELPAEPTAASRARSLVRQTLRQWGLPALEDTAVLLVSELVTNSLRYAQGPIGVRMVRGASLLVEVSDPLPDPPRERRVDHTDEGGRGLQLVAHSARRWGTRHSRTGKAVWFELALPTG